MREPVNPIPVRRDGESRSEYDDRVLAWMDEEIKVAIIETLSSDKVGRSIK